MRDLDAISYMEQTTGTFYSVETHILYLQELKLDSPLRVESQIVGLDRKRLHIFSTIYHAAEEFRAATGETMLVHYVQDEGKVLAMPDEIYGRIEALANQHKDLLTPKEAGRAVRRLG